MDKVFMQSLSYSDIISAAWSATIFFLWAAIILFTALSATQIYLEKKRSVINAKKSEYIQNVNMIHFGKEVPIMVKNRFEYLALAEAISEINNFYSQEDRHIIYDIIEQTKLDIYLWQRYQASIFKFQKKYFLSLLVHLLYPPLKSFFLKKMYSKDDFIKKYALYGFTALSSTAADLEYISIYMRDISESDLSDQFYEFLFEQILKQTTLSELDNFISKLTINDKKAAKSILCTIKNLGKCELGSSAEKIYQLFKDDNEFIVYSIETMKKLGIKNCKMIKENYLSQNDIIREVCSANAFSLCGKEAIEFLYIYFFDSNENVRSSILTESKKIGLKSEDILRIIDNKTHGANINKFIMSTIKSW